MLFSDSSPPPPSVYLLGGAWRGAGRGLGCGELSARWSWGQRLLETYDEGRMTKPEAGRATDPSCDGAHPSLLCLWAKQSFPPSLTLSSGLIWNLLRPFLFYPSLPLYRYGDLIGLHVISYLGQPYLRACHY